MTNGQIDNLLTPYILRYEELETLEIKTARFETNQDREDFLADNHGDIEILALEEAPIA